MGQGSEQTFFQRRQADGHQTREKVPNIINLQENANQLTPVWMAIIKRIKDYDKQNRGSSKK